MRSGTGDSTAPLVARAASAAGETSALETRGGDGLDECSESGETGRRAGGIGDGRGGGATDARFVPWTIGVVAGSGGSGAGGSAAGRATMGTAAGEPAKGGGMDFGEDCRDAGFVGDEPTASDEPMASFGSSCGGAPGFAAGVFFIFTTLVGAAVSGRSLEDISFPSLLLESRPGSSGSRDRAGP
jgi:hypothetical protein